MQTPILQESNYKEEMQTIVEPYLVSIGEPTCGCDVVTWIY